MYQNIDAVIWMLHLYILFSFFLIFKDFFLNVDPLKSSLNLLQHSFCFIYIYIFGCEAYVIAASQPGTEPTPSALEGEPPEKAFFFSFYCGKNKTKQNT